MPTEFDQFGIRKAGDLSHVSEDAFVAADELITPMTNNSELPTNPTPPNLSHREPRRKRRRLPVDLEQVPPTFLGDDQDLIHDKSSAERPLSS